MPGYKNNILIFGLNRTAFLSVYKITNSQCNKNNFFIFYLVYMELEKIKINKYLQHIIMRETIDSKMFMHVSEYSKTPKNL